jgi:hypothetical protein
MRQLLINGEIHDAPNEWVPSHEFIAQNESVIECSRSPLGVAPISVGLYERAEAFWVVIDGEPVMQWRAVALTASEIEVLRQTFVLTRAQFGEMLIRRGIKAQVESAINSIADATEKAIMIEWFEYTSTVRRKGPKIEALREVLNITPEVADEWFSAAMLYE